MDNLAVIDGCDTTPKLFKNRCRELSTTIALREKEFGIWHSFSWSDYYKKAQCVGTALIALGIEPGHVVSILSENNKEWLFVDMATMCVGGISNGVYTTDSYSQLQHVCVDSETRILFVEDEEQLDKFLEIEKELPLVKKVIVFDDDGLKTFRHPKVMFMDELYQLGEENFEKLHHEFDVRLDNVCPEDTAILVYTSGTTGPPKGAMLTHQNLLFQARNAGSWIGDEASEEIISILPLCHIAERTFSVFLPLNFKWIVNFVESPETSFENTMEVSPTLFFGVPRMWEKMHSNTVIKISEAVWLGRIAYEFSIKIGQKYAQIIDEGGAPNPVLRLARWVAEKTVFRNLKIMLGLDRARILFTGAAPVSPELIAWYRALGLNLFELYGQTECAGITTSNTRANNRIGTIGKAVGNVDIRIDETGEILCRGPHVFKGYFGNPEKTAETVVDGWLYTGDIGTMDDEGYLRITDRKKDIIITAGGKNISPSEIENLLKFSPYISDAVVIGDKRKYLTCLIMIDHENVLNFAQNKNVPFTDFASLSAQPEIVDLIGIEIENVNTKFARVETIKKFKIIDEQLTADDEELTATMKLKRSTVEKKYSSLINSMY